MDSTSFFDIIHEIEDRWKFVDKLADKLGLGEGFGLSALEETFDEMLKHQKTCSGPSQFNGEIEELRNQFNIMSDNLTEMEGAIYNTERYKSDIETTLGEFDQIIHNLESEQ